MNNLDFLDADFTEVIPDNRVIPVNFAQKPHIASTPDAQGRTLPAHPPAHPAQEGAHYTAHQISALLRRYRKGRYPTLGKNGNPLQPGAVRTRWYEWIKQVCPDESLLKNEKLFTQLASDLFDDFAHCCKVGNQQPADWVKDARQRFTDQLSQSTALSISVVTEVRDLARNRADQEREAGDRELKDLQDLIAEFRGVESDLSDTEIRLAQQRGARKGIAKFKVELKAEIETVSQLRKQVMGDG